MAIDSSIQSKKDDNIKTVKNELLNDIRIIEEIFDFYEEDLKKLVISPGTGERLALPSSIKGKSQLLNLYLFDPEIALVWGGPIAFTQLDMYRPYLKYKRHRTVIFAKSLKNKSRSDLKLNDIPMFTPTDDFNPVTFLYGIKSLKSLLYISHKADNYKYIANNSNLIHIYAGHGDGEKHSASFRLATAYDFIMCSGIASINRYQNKGIQLLRDQFILTGNPAIEGLKYKKDRKNLLANILYSPTWEGHSSAADFSSVLSVYTHLKEFVKEEGVLHSRMHPGLGKRLKDLLAIKDDLNNISPFINKTSKVKSFNWSDAVITDVSGIVSEYLFTGKPIIIPLSKKGWKYQYVMESSLVDYCYIWFYEEIPLNLFLKEISNDPLYNSRNAYREERYLGAKSIKELCGIFHNSIDYTNTLYNQRHLKQLYSVQYKEHCNNKNTLLQKLPNDVFLQGIILSIKQGNNFLGEDLNF